MQGYIVEMYDLDAIKRAISKFNPPRTSNPSSKQLYKDYPDIFYFIKYLYKNNE